MSGLSPVLQGAVAMTSLVAAMFFFRFWRQTHDGFFVLFATAFGIDAVARFVLASHAVRQEDEPLYYIPRLIMFGLIIAAIVQKNRPAGKD